MLYVAWHIVHSHFNSNMWRWSDWIAKRITSKHINVRPAFLLLWMYCTHWPCVCVCMFCSICKGKRARSKTKRNEERENERCDVFCCCCCWIECECAVTTHPCRFLFVYRTLGLQEGMIVSAVLWHFQLRFFNRTEQDRTGECVLNALCMNRIVLLVLLLVHLYKYSSDIGT